MLAACLLVVILLCGSWWFVGIMSIISFVATWEMLRCTSLDKVYSISVPAYILSVLMPISTKVDFVHDVSYVYIISFSAVYLLLLLVLFKSDAEITFEKITTAFLSLFYIIAGFTFLTRLGCVENGMFWFVCAWVTAIFTDTFAYFTGMLFGKHKLCPAISPKKTVEGAIGGIVFCTISLFVYSIIVENFFGRGVASLTLCILAPFLSVISQLGDLILSAIKRRFDVKDYGKIFPGHGGVLDRFDSVIAVAMLLSAAERLFDIVNVLG